MQMKQWSCTQNNITYEKSSKKVTTIDNLPWRCRGRSLKASAVSHFAVCFEQNQLLLACGAHAFFTLFTQVQPHLVGLVSPRSAWSLQIGVAASARVVVVRAWWWALVGRVVSSS